MILVYYFSSDIIIGLSVDIKRIINIAIPAESNVVKRETLSIKANDGRNTTSKSVFLYLYDMALMRYIKAIKTIPMKMNPRMPHAAMPSVRNRLALAFWVP